MANLLIGLSLLLGFVDEGVRKILPGAPVWVTSVKVLTALLALAFWAGEAGGPPGVAVKYHVLWLVAVFLSACSLVVQGMPVVPVLISSLVYCGCVFYTLVGVKIGADPALFSGIKTLFWVGVVLSLCVGFAQEFDRGALPRFFSKRIFIEKHSDAVGSYVESIFASPTIFAEFLTVALACTLFDGEEAGYWGPVFSGALVLGILVSRTRAAIVFAAALLLLKLATLAFGSKRGLRRGAAGFLTLFCVVASVYACSDLAKDSSFFSATIDSGQLEGRALIFGNERGALVDHDWVLGYGIGTGGSMRSMYGASVDAIPEVYDTGLFLLYHELGAVGVASFLAIFLGLAVHAYGRGRAEFRSNLRYYASILVLLAWFLFKTHAMLSNIFSCMLWFGLVGLVLGRSGAPAPQAAAE